MDFNRKETSRALVLPFSDLAVQGVAGKLAEPMRWKVKDSLITEMGGGGEVGEECRRLFQEAPESNRLIEIMFGYHPKASARHGIDDPMHWELISKMPWAGLGTPRKHPNFRHMDGSVSRRLRPDAWAFYMRRIATAVENIHVCLVCSGPTPNLSQLSEISFDQGTGKSRPSGRSPDSMTGGLGGTTGKSPNQVSSQVSTILGIVPS